MRTKKSYLIHIAVAFLLTILAAACTSERQKLVAVSQCSMDEWRDQMNEEMRREAFCHPEIKVEYHSTADNSADQIRDIESFIKRKVDLIVVAPNEEVALRPVVEKAYDAGIPIVLIDRKINSDKYTAYVGGDNVDVGRQAARLILSKLPAGGNIVEIEGLTSSSSSQERKQGFHEVMDAHPEINIVATVACDWQKRKAREAIKALDLRGQQIDIVFAYNDRMAIGAKEAMPWSKAQFVGVDALMNDSIGVGRIEDGTLEASFLYSTGGDKAIHTAACILNGKHYTREQVMSTSLVNKGNVHLMRLQADHIDEQNGKIEFLNDKLDLFFKRYSAQRALLYTFVSLVIVIAILLAVSIRAYSTKHKLNIKLALQKTILSQQRDELTEQKKTLEKQKSILSQQRDELAEQKKTLEEQKTTLCRQRDELAEQKETLERQRDLLEEERDKLMEQMLREQQAARAASDTPSDTDDAGTPSTERSSDRFMERLSEVIENMLDRPDLTVDMIGAEVNLGRVQLYRRCKLASGMSPNELLRSTRLNKGYQMLRDTDMTVSEVAYSVGFSSPSYFAKCYKELFGKNPTAR